MKKILVTTDLSPQSKSAAMFAIQLASQQPCDIEFFHSYSVLTPVSWNYVRAEQYHKEHADFLRIKLQKFIKSVYRKANVKIPKSRGIIQTSIDPQSNIMTYALENKYDFICMSTRGAGKLKRLLGTTTGNLIKHSEIPVLAIPYNYRTHSIGTFLYASDLERIEIELKQVYAFAKPMNAKIELVHFRSILDDTPDKESLKLIINKLIKYPVNLDFVYTDLEKSIVENIKIAIKKIKPSLLIMFTDQRRSFFRQIFHPSKSAEYSFSSKVPLLVFNKA